jgi:choline dehydrogenase
MDSKGKRVSSETAYFTPEVLARPNLHVAIHARVNRVLFEGAGAGQPRAVGVEFVFKGSSKAYRAYAGREVIVS